MYNNIRVDSSDVQRNVELLVSYLHSRSSNGNYSEGTILHDLIVTPVASVMSLIEGEISSLERRLSLQRLSSEETESASDLIDQIASNFFIERKRGTKAQGIVTLRMSTNDAVVILPGTVFTKTMGVEFVYDEPTNLVIEDLEAEVIDGEATGFYYADVFVTATRDYIGSEMPPGTLESMTNSPRNLDSIITRDTFGSAEGVEPNIFFINRIKGALNSRNFNTEKGIRTVLLDSVDSCKKVQVVGAGDVAMQRDLLSVGGPNMLHTLGKINVYTDSGYSIVRSTLVNTSNNNFCSIRGVDTNTGTIVGVKSSFNNGNLVLYGNKDISGLQQDDSLYIETLQNNGIVVTYADSNNARSSTEDISVTVDNVVTTAHPSITYELVNANNYSTLNTYVETESLAGAATDTKIYYSTIKDLSIYIEYYRNPTIEQNDVPIPVIKNDVIRFVRENSVLYKELSISELLSYISNNYSPYINSIKSSTVEVKFTVLLTNGNEVHYKVVSDTSFSNSVPYYVRYTRQGTALVETEVDNYIDTDYIHSLQVSDKTCSLYLKPSNITMNEISI